MLILFMLTNFTKGRICAIISLELYEKGKRLMKRYLLMAFLGLLFISGTAQARTDLTCPHDILAKKDLTVLTKGQSFSYPLPEGSVIECYAKRIDGSVDDFEEYNDYFVMRNGRLYSNTMHKIYKPHKMDKLKKVDRAGLQSDNKTLRLYDPLWEWSVRHHMRTVKINTKTGEYFMDGTQDNWMWYRNITSTGYCRVIYPDSKEE